MVRRSFLIAVALFAVHPLAAAPQLKPKKIDAPALAGTSWTGTTAEGWEMTIEFTADGTMKYSYKGNSYVRASWKQDGDKVYYEMNDRYCEFDGKYVGDAIEGESHNVTGRRWPTRLTRIRDR